MKILSSLLFGVVIISVLFGTMYANASEENIPTWIKNTAGWWSDGMISDNEFLQAIQYLIDNKILSTDKNKSTANVIESENNNKIIPSDIFPQKFHTKGNKILDEQGNQVILRGVNAIDPVAHATWGEEALGEWNEDYYKKIKEFGSDIVRIPLHPAVWTDSDRNFEILDQTIKWIGNQKMYVIIDYHSIGFLPDNNYEETDHKTSDAEIKEFWKSIAKRYTDNDVVIFYDIFNEPTNLKRDSSMYNASESSIDWKRWKTSAEGIIDVIRQVDPDTIVLVGGMQWAYDLTFVLDNPINRENIVYAIHPYPGKADTLSWEDAFGKVSKQYPIFAGEVGFWSKSEIKELTGGAKVDADTWNSVYIEASYEKGLYREDIINFLNKNDIGWTAWHFSPVWGPVLLKNWDYDLTEAGNFFHEQLTK